MAFEQDFDEASRSQWSSAAAGWAAEAERRERGPAGRAADWMLRAAALERGERVLELACGAGDVGLRAAEAVGPEGRVLCTDFAQPMVDLVRERAAAQGLAQVEARVLDAQDPDLGDERFDAVVACNVRAFWTPPAPEWDVVGRVLTPGGRVVVAFSLMDPGAEPRLVAGLARVAGSRGFAVSATTSTTATTPYATAAVELRRPGDG